MTYAVHEVYSIDQFIHRKSYIKAYEIYGLVLIIRASEVNIYAHISVIPSGVERHVNLYILCHAKRKRCFAVLCT